LSEQRWYCINQQIIEEIINHFGRTGSNQRPRLRKFHAEIFLSKFLNNERVLSANELSRPIEYIKRIVKYSKWYLSFINEEAGEVHIEDNFFLRMEGWHKQYQEFEELDHSDANLIEQGIIIDGVSQNATAYNTFYDLGNGFNGSAFPASSIIVIDAENNVSIGDMFGRNTAQSSTYPRINLTDTTSIALGMSIAGITYYQDNIQNNTQANQLELGRYHRTAGIRDDLRDDSTQANLVVVDTDILKIPAFKLDYTIVRNNYYRTGTMTVVSGQEGTPGTGFSYCDDYVENGDTQVILEAEHNLNAVTPLVTIKYTATGLGDGTIKYSIAHID
jgi:hypothetical protein